MPCEDGKESDYFPQSGRSSGAFRARVWLSWLKAGVGCDLSQNGYVAVIVFFLFFFRGLGKRASPGRRALPHAQMPVLLGYSKCQLEKATEGEVAILHPRRSCIPPGTLLPGLLLVGGNFVVVPVLFTQGNSNTGGRVGILGPFLDLKPAHPDQCASASVAMKLPLQSTNKAAETRT